MARSASDIARAVEILKAGGLVALPTETVYGLAADAENELAVRKIFAAKGRPSAHPLIVHLPEQAAAASWASAWSKWAEQLASAFWPGPLTLVVPRTERASDAVTGGQDTVALRVPNHPLARQVLRQFGGGVAAPSANRFGAVSPTTADHVRADLGASVDFILDGGPCAIGVESTIVDLSGPSPSILRPGGVTQEALEQVAGVRIPVAQSSEVRAPGQLESHYAPRAGLELVDPRALGQRVSELQAEGKKVAVLSADPGPYAPGARHFPIPEDPAGVARVLYATLREIDLAGCEVIVASLPAREGLGLAVRDRLVKASAPR